MEKFSYEANGYNRDEVNNFVKEVIQETESIVNKLNEQDITIEKLRTQLEAEKNSTRVLDEIISMAEKNRDDIIRLAEEERERIISDAKHNASVIVNDALMEAQKIEFKTDLLETKLKMLKKKIKVELWFLLMISHSQLTVLPPLAREILLMISTPVYFSASGLASSGAGTT